MTKPYRRLLAALISTCFLFVILTYNKNMDFEPTNSSGDAKLARRLAAKQKLWPHKFIRNLTCDGFLDGTATQADINKVKNSWNYTDEFFFKHVNMSSCNDIKAMFDFNTAPMSKEEAEYPLAYGMIVYKNLAQVYYTMSSIYHPQNAYCIAIDGKTKQKFKDGIQKLATCFPNITIIPEQSIRWCSKSVLYSLLDCFQSLTFSSHSWRYYQYFSGFDLPLKTNLEMVRIFKQLNGSVIGEATFGGRIRTVKRLNNDTTLPILKASMGVLVSREAADDALKNATNHRMIDEALNHIYNKSYTFYKCCSDELFWSTVFGNKKVMPIRGSYDAAEILKEKLMKEYFSVIWKQNISAIVRTPAEPFPLEHYNLARYQVWSGKKAICKGKYKASSCVFGLGDLHRLIGRAELAVHKFHMDIQPAAFFCLWKHVKDRAYDPKQRLFKGHNYQKLPHVQLNNGKSVKELRLEYINQRLQMN